MIRTATLCCLALATSTLFGAMGGPDAYGYIWKDSNEPDGPVYEWTDIIGTGTLIMGLGDDNVVGPYAMETDHPFYWYGRKNIWIGSNGYIAFNAGNIASPFPIIPQAGGVNDHIAAMTADLTFAGEGNPGRCYWYDDLDQTIISYIDVPFWTATAPSYTGSNTFQVVLNKLDSSITIHYQTQTGTTQNNDLLIGIESVAGSIGLQHSADIYPPTNFAIRFYMPPSTELEIIDAAVNFNTAPGNGGLFLSRNGPAFGLSSNVINTGNVDLADIDVDCAVRNLANVLQVSGSAVIDELEATLDANVNFDDPFDPTAPGTFSFTTTVSGIANELVPVNNSKTQELVVVDTTLATHELTYAGTLDDGVGLGWDGGNGGVAMHLVPPYHPAYAAATTVRITSNAGLSGFSMKVYADNGPGGTAGTLLDSVNVTPDMVAIGDMEIPLSAPLTIASGGVYVLWYMNGPNVNIAEDIAPPFSLRTYEVLGNTWAEYRDRENTDFHIGLLLTQAPVFDVGVSGFFGTATGQNIEEPITVRTWITNYGNQDATDFPVSYQFENGPVVTDTYDGAPIAPGAQQLFSFSQLFDPNETTTGDLCAWSGWSTDGTADNDTSCVNVNVFVGLAERSTALLRAWPNPAANELSIAGLSTGPCALDLFDATGRAVFQHQGNITTEPFTLDVRAVPPGAYHLRLVQHGRTYRAAVVIQR